MTTSPLAPLPHFSPHDTDFPSEPAEDAQSSYDAGYQSGLQIHRQKHALYRNIIRQSATEIQNSLKALEKRHSTALLTLLEAVLPDIIIETSRQAIVQQIEDAARKTLDVTLTVKANPKLCDEIAPILADMELPHIQLVPDANISHFDVEMIWPDGGIDLNFDHVKSTCLSLVQDALATTSGDLPHE